MACYIKVEPEESAEGCMDITPPYAMCAPSDQITEIKIEEEYGANDVLHSGELSCNDIKTEIEAEEDEKVTEKCLDKPTSPIKEETVDSDSEVKNYKDLNEFQDRSNTSSLNISILKGLLIQKENNSSVNKEHENETALLSNSEQDKSLDEENFIEESSAVEKFRVNMSAIESVSKENQVSHL